MNTQVSFQRTCQMMVDILKVDHSAVFIFNAEHESVILAAEYPGVATQPGRSIALPDFATIQSYLKGKTSLFIEYVASHDSLGSLRSLLLEWGVRSTLIVPFSGDNQVLGFCSADAIHHPRGFPFEDVQRGEAFAAQALLGIENLHLQAEHKRDKARLERLMECTPSAVIEVDAKGNVTGCNSQAWQMLGYKGPDEIPGHVKDLYFYPTEPYEIGKRLHANGYLTNYETLARNKNGDPIPIRISVRHLLDEHQQRVLSIGNFQDLRLINEAEKRFDLLWKASVPPVNSKEIAHWFERLSSMILSVFPHTFCQIALLDETQSWLTVKASVAGTVHESPLTWTPNTERQIDVSRWLGLRAALHAGDPIHLHSSDRGSRSKLIGYSGQLNLKQDIQSLLVIPLKIGEQPIGLFNLGEIRKESEVPFSRGEVSRVASLAPQIANLIARALLAQTHAKLVEQLNRSNTAAQHIASVLARGDLDATLQAVTRETCKALEADAVTLYVHDPVSKTIRNPPQMYGVRHPEALKQMNPLPKNSIVWRILGQREPDIMEDIAKDTLFKESRFTQEEAIRSCVAVPLTAAGLAVGVMFINYRTLHQFLPDDLTTFTHFANQAAVAIYNAQLFEALRKAKEQLTLKTTITLMGIAMAESAHGTLTDMTTIRDIVELINRDLASGVVIERMKERLKTLDAVATRIQENLKHASLSPEEGQQSVPVNDLIRNQLSHWKERIPSWYETAIAVDFRQEIKLPSYYSVHVNPQWLTRVLNLLVSNALTAVADVPQPTITVTTQFLDGGVGILVSDTGCGIPDSIRPHFLKRQIKKSTRSKGSGMGVLLAQEIIETYGGEIRLGATGANGTTMIIWLPLEPQLLESDQPRSDAVLSTIPILLVGDPQDSDWIRILGDTLTPFGGVEVVRECELLWHLQKKKYQLVLLDEKSVSNSLSLTEQICSYAPGVRVVVAAESPKWEFAREQFRAGAADCLPRSACPDELRALLNSASTPTGAYVELSASLGIRRNGHPQHAN